MKFPKPLPRVVDKRASKREEQSTLRSVYKQVDQRDKVCRCCGSKELLEHHHLIPRSRGGQHLLSNILRLCRTCHRLCQTHWIWIEGDDCNGKLVFNEPEGRGGAVLAPGDPGAGSDREGREGLGGSNG